MAEDDRSTQDAADKEVELRRQEREAREHEPAERNPQDRDGPAVGGGEAPEIE